jgi:hypothetical protein
MFIGGDTGDDVLGALCPNHGGERRARPRRGSKEQHALAMARRWFGAAE